MLHSKIIFAGLMMVALATAQAWSNTGVASVKGTAPDSTLAGTVTFRDTPEGLRISAQLSRVPPGKHGFHIHEFGSCEDMGKAAGGHYNPLSSPHGLVTKDGLHGAHAGDLGNITADEKGNASLESIIPDVSLGGGKYTVGGRAVILHEKADDFGQPVGNAGSRIGCGGIAITGP